MPNGWSRGMGTSGRSAVNPPVGSKVRLLEPLRVGRHRPWGCDGRASFRARAVPRTAILRVSVDGYSCGRSGVQRTVHNRKTQLTKERRESPAAIGARERLLSTRAM
jgi:hypothetical protein